MSKLLPAGLVTLFCLLLCTPEAGALEVQHGLQSLASGSSLSAEAKEDFLVSPNGTFSSGFYEVGTNAYCFSIWFTYSKNKTVVWMANRDRPVNGRHSKLTLHESGNLVLTDADGSTVWQTSTFSQGPQQASLLETGNLVLASPGGDVIWESFGFATDTLLPMQKLTKSITLVSKRGQGNYFSGFYKLHFSDNNVLTLIHDGLEFASAYWPGVDFTVFSSERTPYNSSRWAFLDAMGRFKSTDNLKFNAVDIGIGPKRRLTLDYDGIFRLYSLDETTGEWEVSYLPPIPSCSVHGLCGRYGICTYKPFPTCECPPGFPMADPSDWSKGCSRPSNFSCDPAMTDFIELQNTDYYGHDMETWGVNKSLESCRNLCANDCRCKGFAYVSGEGKCFTKSRLLNGFQMPGNNRTVYARILKGGARKAGSTSNRSGLLCQDTGLVLQTLERREHKDGYFKYLIAFVGAMGLVEIVCILMGWLYIQRKHENQDAIDNGYLALVLGFRRFTQQELRSATRNFKEEIGRGGFGAVYKGVLDDGKVVAVKKLDGFEQGEAEFWAEVSIIGKLNHMNLVKMWGFCAEEKNKLLVYEYMENGSLDKTLFSSSSDTLNWEKRFQIALGMAKGLSYLHEDCLEWVLHCDIKPQNILLDENLQPKLSDFGLSKLVQKKGHNSGFSRVRGTRGYLAPEWMMNQQIDAKADVYSYGVVLLELISGKTVLSFTSEARGNERSNDLARCVIDKMKKGDGVKELIDHRLAGNYKKAEAEKLVELALLCVREDKHERPAMSEVVNLLTKCHIQGFA